MAELNLGLVGCPEEEKAVRRHWGRNGRDDVGVLRGLLRKPEDVEEDAAAERKARREIGRHLHPSAPQQFRVLGGGKYSGSTNGNDTYVVGAGEGKPTVSSPKPGHKGCLSSEPGVRSETGSMFLRTMDDDLHAGDAQAAAAEARARRAAGDGNWANGRPPPGFVMKKGWGL